MYTLFYELEKKPFQISSDPGFLWLGEKHKEALAVLKYGVLDSKGFLLLTGDVGTGKTTLIHSLIESLSDDVIFASVPDPALTKLDFFNYIAMEFGIDQVFDSKGAFLVGFRKFLLKAYGDDKKVLLIIDEAQLLTQELLEEIRLLSNIEKTHTKLINIFFVGQNEFNDSLNLPQNRAVRQRLTLNYHIDPLTPDETDEYINYRLKVAGAQQEIFEPGAVQEVFMYSGGFPRRINVICDHALLSGYVQESPTIDVNIIKECAKDLKIPVYGRHLDSDGFGAYQATPVPPASPVHKTPPRPVVIQPALPEKKEHFLSGKAAGVLGLLIVLGIVFYLFFSGNFSILNHQAGLSGSDSWVSRITSRFTGRTSVKKRMPAAPVSQPVEQENKPEIQKKSLAANPAVTIPQETISKAGKTETQDIPGYDISQKAPAEAQEPVESADETMNVLIIPDVTGSPPDETKEEKIKEQAQKLPLPADKIIIRFKYDTNEFTEQGLEILKEFADILTDYPDARIKITGYSDSAGYPKYNERLSKFRANIVRSFFMGRGAGVDQFEVIGLGSENPVESNSTAWGRMMNRRVEVEVLQ